MKEDFHEFLYNNSLSNFDWRVLQEQNSENALQILATYSDLTIDKVMKSVKYLEYRTEQTLFLLKVEENSKTTLGISLPKFSTINLKNGIEDRINELINSKFKSFKKTEKYTEKREKEVFKLIESGYHPIDEKAFNQLNFLRQKYLN